ncbi:hypothetical protein [Rhodoglobus vestalii]|uniref:hypothetical protein n=1 Tax=Rhodoglobus vestalii TaxID=193384 RepID=UPI001152F8D8|nr:hypothetical protein [Rhodoglobus vestalii]
MLEERDDEIRAVAWLVFFSAEPPVRVRRGDNPELSITTFDGFRGQGIGAKFLRKLIVATAE